MLAFMRHGQTDWNHASRLQGRADIPLNDVGRGQALEAARLMRDAGHEWHLVVTSPLSRARETGRIVAEELGIELGPAYEDLVERSFGPNEGSSVAGISLEDYERLLEVAEPEAEVIARGTGALQHVRQEFPGRNVLLVAHGTLIRFTVAFLQDAEPRRVRNAEVVPLDDALVAVPSHS